MKSICSVIIFSLSVNISLFGQLVTNPKFQFERLRWGMKLSEALISVLRDPPPILSRDKKTGEILLARGHFFYSGNETLFDRSAKVSYAFSQSDSVLRYVLITYFEADKIPGSPAGGRDSLWNRISRRYGATAAETRKGEMTQREWTRDGTWIICTKVDGLARTLVLSLTPTKKK